MALRKEIWEINQSHEIRSKKFWFCKWKRDKNFDFVNEKETNFDFVNEKETKAVGDSFLFPDGFLSKTMPLFEEIWKSIANGEWNDSGVARKRKAITKCGENHIGFGNIGNEIKKKEGSVVRRCLNRPL